MINEMGGSEIYKRLAGGQKKPTSNIIGYILKGVLIYLVTAFILLHTTYMDHNYYARLSFSVAFILVVPIYTWYAVKQIKQAARKIQKRQEMIKAMSEMEFYKLDSQLMENKYYFKTFYFLDEYMYVPRYRLLIKYTDIVSFRTKIRYSKHRAFELGASVELIDSDDLIYKIKIRQWDKYLKQREMVEIILHDKMTKQVWIRSEI